MIKVNDGFVGLKGSKKTLIADLTMLLVALFKNNIPIGWVMDAVALAKYESENITIDDDGNVSHVYESEEIMMDDLKKTFKRMSDEDKAKIVQMLAEAVEDD